MNLREQTTQQATRGIIRLLPKISDENLICLTRFGLWLTEDPEVVDVIEKVKGLLETPGHPAKELFRRALDSLPEKRRIRVFETLFNGGPE